jgi:ferritin-like metal-binding protein YciE
MGLRDRSFLSLRPGNLSSAERWMSMLAGIGLTVIAVRGGGLVRRGVLSAAGLSLMSRGAAGHCGVKAAINGQTTLAEGLSEQWQRLRAAFGTGAGSIDSMHKLYLEELQELHSGDGQLRRLLESLCELTEHRELEQRMRGYVTEVRTRERDLERTLAASGIDALEHLDQGMQALVNEARKMAQVCGANVRDAALAASLQRLLHYRIAAYGSAAAYARVLGRTEEVARLEGYAARDQAVASDLSELSQGLLNRHAAADPKGRAGHEPRTH